MVSTGRLMELIAEARNDPEKLPAALMAFGVILGAVALSLVVFKAPGGVFLRLHGGAPGFVYYGILIAVVVFGFAEASFGFWMVPSELNGWRAGVGKTMLWISVLLLVLVAALGGLAFLK